MTIARLSKSQAKKVLGIDASTNSIAYCLFWNRKPIKWGKILLNGATIYDRILDAKVKVMALQTVFKADYVAIESAVFVKSPSVAIKLAYVFGTILAELQYMGAKVVDTAPLTWQNYIGNGPLKKAEKDALKKEFPGKSPTWYSNKGRQLRKQRTMDFFNNKWDMQLDDDDVGDACGLAYHAYHELTRRT